MLDIVTIGVKRMGEVDQKPFQDVCLQRFSGEDWEVRAVEQSSLWQEKVRSRLATFQKNDQRWKIAGIVKFVL